MLVYVWGNPQTAVASTLAVESPERPWGIDPADVLLDVIQIDPDRDRVEIASDGSVRVAALAE